MGDEMEKEAELTMKILGISENDKGIYNRINKNGFKVNECKNKKNKYINECKKNKYILVLGINPAGDENSAEYDQNYLYYIPTITAKKGEKRFYNKYFKPIYDLFDEATEQKIKWDWCNLEDIENIKNEIDGQNFGKIEKFYKESNKKEFTILSGDLFYYHETSQEKFKKLLKKGINENLDEKGEKQNEKNRKKFLYPQIKEILNIHIKKILDEGDLKLIYINNAYASDLIYESILEEPVKESEKLPTKKVYKFEYKNNVYSIPILFGGMLSGQRAMDKYSKARLKKEIKEILEKKKNK